MTAFRYHKRAYAVVIAAWLGWLLLMALAPSTGSANQLRLGPTTSLLIIMSVIVPLLAIWLVALRGAEVFWAYSSAIGSHHGEGRAISRLAIGLYITLGYLIANQLMGSSMAYWAHTPFLSTAAVVRDHLPAIASLVAFGTLYVGSHQLKQLAHVETWSSATAMALIGFCVLAVGLVWLFMSHNRSSASNIPVYSLPRPILLFTLILPYFLAWFLGLLAALNIAKYAREVKGIIYRQALSKFAWGIVGVVAFGIIYQIVALLNRYLLGLPLRWILAILYGILVLYGLGFWLVRAGAKKLMQIEVVQ